MEHEGDETKDELYTIRHSLAHVLAQAVLKIRPGAKLGFGPPISDGFYYDFVLPTPITEEDFPEIEKAMKHILKEGQKFELEELPEQDALERISQMGEPYKREYAQELFRKKNLKSLKFYKNGPFLDMCEGPHVTSTGKLPQGAFKLRSVAGAYWRGDSKNQMMTRIYAWAFKTKEELDSHVKAYQEALARDHKKLGKELDLYMIDDEIGKGLPLWLPNGAILRNELERLMVELEFKAGFQRVSTPHITKSSLYYKTGHLPYYATHMYPFMELKESVIDGEHPEAQDLKEAYCLKPMNCPHHHKIFAARPRSYRDLPLRLAEYGTVYRFEDSGALSGLLRVRSLSMNDAHIYCTEDQILPEFLSVMAMHKELYSILGFKNYVMRFSTWDPEDPKGREKFVDNPAAWEKTQAIVRQAMEQSGLPYVEGKGEGAFYGPKIDFQLKTVTGREETASTNQLDFAVPERLGLRYIGADNQEHMPYVIHRAPAGTHERFVAFMIEHFGGAFPTWLAPVQVLAITVNEKFNSYAEKLIAELRGSPIMIRAELDKTTDTLNKKIRNGTTQKIPNLLIIGEKEEASETVTLRRYGKQEQKTMKFAEFKDWISDQITNRKLE